MEMSIGRLKQIISKSRVGMLGTYSGSRINFRPMTHVDADDDGTIWFFTSLALTKAADLKKNPSAILMYSNETENNYLTLNGSVFLNKDRSKMKELFTPYVKAWFPKGLEDPNICLLGVVPDEFEYWSANENKVVTSFKMAWAAMMSTKPHVGEHGVYTL